MIRMLMGFVGLAHPKRVPQLPDVPTMDELGIRGFASNSGFLTLQQAARRQKYSTG